MIIDRERREYRLEREYDGRWLAELIAQHGLIQYGATPTEAIANIDAIADSEPETYDFRES